MVFIDGAIARLAPDLDLFGEITQLSIYFATRHGDRIFADVGVDPRAVEVDLSGVKASIGVDDATEQLTHRDLQARRETIRRNLSRRRRRSGPTG
jgi:ubiquinone biosynthesis protein